MRVLCPEVRRGLAADRAAAPRTARSDGRSGNVCLSGRPSAKLLAAAFAPRSQALLGNILIEALLRDREAELPERNSQAELGNESVAGQATTSKRRQPNASR